MCEGGQEAGCASARVCLCAFTGLRLHQPFKWCAQHANLGTERRARAKSREGIYRVGELWQGYGKDEA